MQELVRRSVGSSDGPDRCAEVFRNEPYGRKRVRVACGDYDVILPVFSPLPEIPYRETVGSWNNIREGSRSCGTDIDRVLIAHGAVFLVHSVLAEDSPGCSGGACDAVDLYRDRTAAGAGNIAFGYERGLVVVKVRKATTGCDGVVEHVVGRLNDATVDGGSGGHAELIDAYIEGAIDTAHRRACGDRCGPDTAGP